VVLKSFFSSFARVVLAFEEKKGRRPPPLLASKTEAAEEEEEEVDADAAEERSKDCPTIRPPLRHPSRVVVILLSFLLLCLACANITTKKLLEKFSKNALLLKNIKLTFVLTFVRRVSFLERRRYTLYIFDRRAFNRVRVRSLRDRRSSSLPLLLLLLLLLRAYTKTI
jgi:hypothetical protein